MMSAEVTHTSIEQVLSRLPGIAERAGHTELYGIDITQVSNPPVKLLAGKYLRAHNNDVDAASKAIEDTLVWRKEFQPRKAAYDEQHAPKFDGIGYNTVLGDDVVVWNIYGALQNRANPADVFEPLEDFIRWRIGLMERAVDLLKLSDYQGDGIIDNKQAIQVHDYLGVSFFRMDSKQRSTTKQIVDLMSKHYPETMKAKYMVNVPLVMSWVMTFIKTFVSRDTISKITVLTYGSALCEYIHHKDLLPEAYGGRSGDTLASLSLQQCVR